MTIFPIISIDVVDVISVAVKIPLPVPVPVTIFVVDVPVPPTASTPSFHVTLTTITRVDR
jgi:hypothetical protein